MSSKDKTIFIYNEDQNPQRAYVPGVPLRDLKESDIAGMPTHALKSVEAVGFYRRVEEGESAASEDTPLADSPSQEEAPKTQTKRRSQKKKVVEASD